VNNRKTMTNGSPIINNLAFNNYDDFTNNGIFVNTGQIANHGVFTNASGTLTNSGRIFFLYNSSFVAAGGVLDGNGATTDWRGTLVVLPHDETITITKDADITIYEPQKFIARGGIHNGATDTLNIFGVLYTYSTIENGDEDTAGTINVHYPGSLYLLGGNIENKNVDSEININSGGSVYNYYGNMDTLLGSLTIKAGGQFHNARGGLSWPAGIIKNNGSEFFDTTVITLDKNLDIDYTWTITGKSVITGLAYDITFGPEGSIVIDHNASLLIEDSICKNISGNKIRCIDNTSTLSIHNTAFVLDGNYSFTQGKFYDQGNWTFLGDGHRFIYKSPHVSTVASGATLIAQGVTIEYQSASNNNLIQFEDSGARLNLNRGRLLATEDWRIKDASLFTTGATTLQAAPAKLLDMSELSAIHMHVAATRIGGVLLGTT